MELTPIQSNADGQTPSTGQELVDAFNGNFATVAAETDKKADKDLSNVSDEIVAEKAGVSNKADKDLSNVLKSDLQSKAEIYETEYTNKTGDKRKLIALKVGDDGDNNRSIGITSDGEPFITLLDPEEDPERIPLALANLSNVNITKCICTISLAVRDKKLYMQQSSILTGDNLEIRLLRLTKRAPYRGKNFSKRETVKCWTIDNNPEKRSLVIYPYSANLGFEIAIGDFTAFVNRYVSTDLKKDSTTEYRVYLKNNAKTKFFTFIKSANNRYLHQDQKCLITQTCGFAIYKSGIRVSNIARFKIGLFIGGSSSLSSFDEIERFIQII